MNDYDLYKRCKAMIDRGPTEVEHRYINLARRHLRQVDGHEWLADQISVDINSQALKNKKPGSLRLLYESQMRPPYFSSQQLSKCYIPIQPWIGQ